LIEDFASEAVYSKEFAVGSDSGLRRIGL